MSIYEQTQASLVNICNRGVLIINKNQCLNFEFREKGDRNLGK